MRPSSTRQNGKRDGLLLQTNERILLAVVSLSPLRVPFLNTKLGDVHIMTPLPWWAVHKAVEFRQF